MTSTLAHLHHQISCILYNALYLNVFLPTLPEPAILPNVKTVMHKPLVFHVFEFLIPRILFRVRPESFQAMHWSRGRSVGLPQPLV